MSSLSLPIVFKIQACMRAWHKKYAAVIATYCFHRLSIDYENTTADAKVEIESDFDEDIAAESEAIRSCPIEIV